MRIAELPEDFRVDELPLYPPRGEGDHTLVRIEKRLLTTEEAVRALARHARVRPAEIGYAGRKDRRAVTRQWLSVPGLAPERALAFEGEGLRVLEAARHPHKLRTGHLRGNRFELVVRGLEAARLERVAARLAELDRVGMPNRFGAQRFGREGENADRGRALLAGELRLRDRRKGRFLLSALQAEVFNACLEARDVPLDAITPGEVAWIHDSGACFVVEASDAETATARARAFEISAAGPLFGTRLLAATGEPGRRECAVLAAHGVPDADLLRATPGIRLRGARRPYRVRPTDVAHEVLHGDALRLCFTLPPGSYATVLVEELLGKAVG